MKRVFVDVKRCMGCKSCELACAVEHSSSKDLFSALFESPPPLKRIHVNKALSFSYPTRCMHCEEAACVIACPSGAMVKNEKTGAVVVNEDKCMGCMMCAMVCPFGAVIFDEVRRVVSKCDFCSSRQKEGRMPACVEACPTRALVYGEEDELIRRKRMAAVKIVVQAISEVNEQRQGKSSLDLLRELGG